MGKKSKAKKAHYDNLIPVFRVVPQYGSNTIKTKIIGTVVDEDNLQDELMEFTYDQKSLDELGKNALYLGKYKNYTISARLFTCNIKGSYLLSSTKWPLYYMSVMYEKQFVSGFIFSVFIYFEVDEKSKAELTTPQKYVGRAIDGKFTLEIEVDDAFMEEFDTKFKSQLEESIMTKYSDKFEELLNNSCGQTEDSQEQIDLMTTILNEVNDEMDKYKKLFNKTEFESFPHRKVLIGRHILPLCKSDEFRKMVDFGIDLRENARTGGQTIDTYEKPGKCINLKEIRENPDLLDKMMEDSDSDNSDSD